MSEAEFNKILSENIIRYLNKFNMSQADLAAELGVSTATISYWCKGLKQPRMDKFDKMCEIFNCKRKDLMDPYNPNKEKAERDSLLEELFRGRPDMKILFDATEDATPDEIMQAVKIIEALKK